MDSQIPEGRGKKPRLDRFGTLRAFIDRGLPGIIGGNSGSMAAALIWVVLFDMASGVDGTIRGASVNNLAARTRMTRVTVRAAMKKLLEAKAITVVSGGRRPVYHMAHLPRETG